MFGTEEAFGLCLSVVEVGVGVGGAKAQLRGSGPRRPIAISEGNPASPEEYWRKVWEIGDWPIFVTPTRRQAVRPSSGTSRLGLPDSMA